MVNEMPTPIPIPSDNQIDTWRCYSSSYEDAVLARERNIAQMAYKAGYNEARQLWPEPITDRRPTRADGDDKGFVQICIINSRWDFRVWSEVGAHPWLHTPCWQSRPEPTLNEQALTELTNSSQLDGHRCITEEAADLILRALEQAGKVKS
jgi:hypothetical protein